MDAVRYFIQTFQSTPPVKAATTYTKGVYYINVISIHAAREGGDLAFCDIGRGQEISIHAAREGGDENIFPVYG